MKVPASWLREYVDFGLPLEDLARKLVFTSCEVDRIVPRGVPDVDGNLGKFLVGKVLEAGKHPNADRLQLCQVDVGEGEPRQIVCGAWNFGAGATVAVALPGALLPGAEQPLGEAKLRGELSRGMILSEREIDLGADHTGIMVLGDGLEPGTPLAEVLPLTDDVLEIETGFNRPDLASIYGIAREVAAVTGGTLAPPPGTDPDRAGDEPVDVRVEDFAGCPRYIGRLFRGATIGESPHWLKARLLAAGMRPISNVVDVTNYVMLAVGSPLHAFDLARLDEGRIVVRRAQPGEKMRTLDGQERELTTDDLVIADASHPVAIAGIMGGEESEVRPETTDLLLEAANFDPLTVLRSSRRLRLRTESSTRWEKGVDPYAAERAAVYATQLLVELAGARWTGHTDVNDGLPERPRVTLQPELADRLSGLEIPVEEQVARLESIGFEVDDRTVTVPTWRARDVTRPVDLVEEVVRFRMEDVPSTLPDRPAKPAQLTREQRLRRQVEDVLVGAGFHEAYTWTLVPEGGWRIPLHEPYTAELAALRDTLEHWLVESARRNRNAGVERIALFELARVFLPSGDVLPGGALARRGDRRRRLFAREGRGRDAPPRASRGGRRGDRPPRARRGLGLLRGRPRLAVPAGAGVRALRGRDHVSGRQAGPRLRRRRGRQGRRARRRGSARRRPRASRDAPVRRLPWRAGRARQEVGRVRRQLPVTGADALGRGRGGAAAADRRGARGALRRRPPCLKSGLGPTA